MTKILISSALPFVNGVKHIGNLIGSLLPADVHARFWRQQGRDVLFISGSDEHGTPAELGAIAAGLDVRNVLRRTTRLAGRHLSAISDCHSIISGDRHRRKTTP